MPTNKPLRRLGAAFVAAGAAVCVTASAAGSSDLVVIVSARNPLAMLRADQAAAIFLGQSVRFPDGAEALPLDQRIGSAARDEFYARVTSKTPALMKAYWSKMVFTGRGQPPAELPDSVTIRRKVADDPDAIGYIERSALDPSVRAVLVVQ
jgi:ABC-type phosphate transport system substrate-binding protein